MNLPWWIGVAAAVVVDAVLGFDAGVRLETAAACLCLAFAQEHRGTDRLVVAWGLGLWRDALSIGPLGTYAASFLLMGVFLESLRGRWFFDNFPTRAGVMFVSVTGVQIVSGLAGGAPIWTLAWTSVVCAIVSAGAVSAAYEAARVGGTWANFASRWSRA
jgi:rod shape-determining protein MreD